MDKKVGRIRRCKKTRARIRAKGIHRLCVHRTPRHIYAQIFDPTGSKVLCSASTLDKALRESVGNGGNAAAATIIGKTIAERARAAGIEQVAFDRSGFKFHGRIKALADAAREGGLKV